MSHLAQSDKLKGYLRNSAESAKSTAPSRWRLSWCACFNTGIMSRARKRAVGGISQVPLKHGPAKLDYFDATFTAFALAFQPSTSTAAAPFADVAVTWRLSPGSSGK